MPNVRIPMRHVEATLRMKDEGKSNREIARCLGVDPRTVRSYVQKAHEAGIRWPLPAGMEHAELERKLFPSAINSTRKGAMPDWEAVARELQQHKHLTLRKLWEEYGAEHPEGLSYPRYCHHYSAWNKRNKVVMHLEHRGGEFYEDFAGDSVPIYDSGTGQIAFEAQIYVGAMGASCYTYAEAFANQKVEAWMTGATHAFEYMGGVPSLVVPDNPKPVVLKASTTNPVLHPSALEWALYYDTFILPARVRKPRDKAVAENAVGIIERQILAALRHHKFYSLYELNLEIRERLDVLNAAPFQQREGSRASVFAAVDKPALHALPVMAYEYAERKEMILGMSYHICVDHWYYSVPYTLAGTIVRSRATRNVVEIFSGETRICTHLRSFYTGKGKRYTTVPEHMPPNHLAYSQMSPARILEWAAAVGPKTVAVCTDIMESRQYPEYGFGACMGVIRLAKTYSKERVEAACNRALEIHNPRYESVESILKRGLDGIPLIPQETPPPIEHKNIRGADHFYNKIHQSITKENITCSPTTR